MAAHGPAERQVFDPALIDEIASRLLDPLAERVVHVLKTQGLLPGASTTKQWLDAAEMAHRLGVTREWVYEHARDLGAVRIGQGPRPRLRFPPDEVSPHPTGRNRRAPKAQREETRRPRGLR